MGLYEIMCVKLLKIVKHCKIQRIFIQLKKNTQSPVSKKTVSLQKRSVVLRTSPRVFSGRTSVAAPAELRAGLPSGEEQRKYCEQYSTQGSDPGGQGPQERGSSRAILEDDSGRRGRASQGQGGRRSLTNLTPSPRSLPQAKLARPRGLSQGR